MTTRMEIFLDHRKWPADSPLRRYATKLGFAKSGFGVGIRDYWDPDTGRVNMAKLTTIFDALDKRTPPWVPQCVNFESFDFYWEEGPISGRQYVNIQRWVSEYMIDRYQRLIPTWGSPNPIHPLAAEAARLWSSAAIGGYWVERQKTGQYIWDTKQRMKLASPFGLPRMLYVTPLVYPPKWQTPARRMGSGQWKHVLNVCEWAVADDPTTMFSFWLNRKLPDPFIRARLAEMAEKLG